MWCELQGTFAPQPCRIVAAFPLSDLQPPCLVAVLLALLSVRCCAQEKKCFDSADWALAKEGKKQQPGAIEPADHPVPEVQHPKHGGSHLKPST